MAVKKKQPPAETPKGQDLSFGVLKKKSLICSTEAVAISIGIHLLLILLAGSWVAVRYVQKQKAEITAYTAPPKMERRQLSAPAKMERIRQTSQRPKIVSSRAAVSDSEFALPAVSGVARVNTQKFSSPFDGAGRDFSILTKGLAFGLPSINFLGVRASGEKLMFVIDASPEMLSESCGGEVACAHIKKELDRVLSELPSSVLFNVILHNGETVSSFRPKMAPVTDANVLAYQEWIAPELSQLSPEGLVPEKNTYEPPIEYDSAVGDEATGLVKAVQAALEQRPDTVFTVGRNWGRHGISREKGQLLMDFSLWQLLHPGLAMNPVLLDIRDMRDNFIVGAVDSIESEDNLLRKERGSVQFVRNLVDYMQYPGEQILDHFDMVFQNNYVPVRQAPPQVHCVRLVSKASLGLSDSSTTNMRNLAGAYGGEFKFFDGTGFLIQKREKELVEEAAAGTNGVVDAEAEALVQAEEDGAAESQFIFFGKKVYSSRMAFVLDVSDSMFAEAVGGQKSFDSIKDKVAQMVQSLEPKSAFNILACNEERVVAFKPDMTPGADSAELDSWFAAVQQGLELPGLPAERVFDVSAADYRTAVGSDVKGVPFALQAAMEQRADTILVAGAGVDRMPVDREKARRLLNFSILHYLGAAGSDRHFKTKPLLSSLTDGESTGMLAELKEDQEQWGEVLAHALELVDEDNRRLKNAGVDIGFIRDVFDFISYTPEQILDHLQAVCRTVYPVDKGKVELPKVHFAKLINRDSKSEREQLGEFHEFANVFYSDLQLVRGAGLGRAGGFGDRSLRRDLSLLPARRHLLLPQFDFMDARAKGERLIFILDASPVMTADETGGEAVCTYIKEQLASTLSELPESVQFNVILYDGEIVSAFRPEMIPATPESLLAVKEWISPALSDLAPAGLAPEQNTYQPQIEYETALGSSAQNWVRAMQAALEQRPDTVLMVGRDWGQQSLGGQKGQRLNDLSLWMRLGGHGPDSIDEAPVLLEDRIMRGDYIKYAADSISLEEEMLRYKKEPPPFPRELTNYMQFLDEQIIEHLTAVCLENYMPAEQGPPLVHWFRLSLEEERKRSDPSNRRMRKLIREYSGELGFLDGTEIRDRYSDEDAEDDASVAGAEEPVESEFKFFGTEVKSSRIAFVLDVSEEVIDEETGGTNSFNFIKGQIAQMVRALEPGTKFNILAYREKRVVPFFPKLASGFDAAELDGWLETIAQKLEPTDDPEELAGDAPISVYKNALGADVQGLPLALQIAIEQRADTILAAGAGFDSLPVNRDRARNLLDFAILASVGIGDYTIETVDDDDDDDDDDEDDPTPDLLEGWSSGKMVAALAADQRQWNAMLGAAVRAIAEDFEERTDEDLPPGFVPDILDYIGYTSGHVQNHLLTVSKAVNPAEDDKVQLPVIHFTNLVAGEQPIDRKQRRAIRAFGRIFGSEVQLFRGASSEKEIRRLNRELDLYDTDAVQK